MILRVYLSGASINFMEYVFCENPNLNWILWNKIHENISMHDKYSKKLKNNLFLKFQLKRAFLHLVI